LLVKIYRLLAPDKIYRQFAAGSSPAAALSIADAEGFDAVTNAAHCPRAGRRHDEPVPVHSDPPGRRSCATRGSSGPAGQRGRAGRPDRAERSRAEPDEIGAGDASAAAIRQLIDAQLASGRFPHLAALAGDPAITMVRDSEQLADQFELGLRLLIDGIGAEAAREQK
jgi:hypothetical protein